MGYGIDCQQIIFGRENDIMNNTSNLKNFFKGSVVLIFSNLCLKAINCLLLPLYTNNLTPQMLGVSDTITSFTGLLFPMLVMGLDSAYSAFYFEKDDKKREDKVFSTLRAAFTVLGVIPMIACFFSKTLSEMLFRNSDYQWVLVIALLSVTLNVWYLPFALEIRMQNRMTIYSIITIISSLLMMCLNIYFVSIVKIGVYALILSTMIVYVVQLILFWLCAKRRFIFGCMDKVLLKEMLCFSLPLIPSVVTMWILNLSDRYVILYCWGEAEVGLYGIANRVAVLLNMVISGVSMAYTTFAYANVDNAEAKKQYALVFNIMYIALIGISFILSMFSREIIQLMAADTYARAYEPLQDMVFSQVIYGLFTIMNYGIYFKKKSKYTVWATTAGAGVNLVLNLMFIPKYGIMAAATTTLIGYLVMFAIVYKYSQKLYPCKYGIKRIAMNMVSLYVILRLTFEMRFLYKIFITLICAGITIYMFRDKVKEIFLCLRRDKR